MISKKILPAVFLATVAAASFKTATPVNAQDLLPQTDAIPAVAKAGTTGIGENAKIYKVSGDDVLSDLKKQEIEDYVSRTATKLDSVDMTRSSLSTSKIDMSSSAVQSVDTQLIVIATDGSVIGTYSSRVGLDIESSSGSGTMVELMYKNISVDLGSAFSYADNVVVYPDQNRNLPVLTEQDDVDTSKEGTYTCTVTATNKLGVSQTVSYSVTVKKTPEMIRQEEEERKAAEEREAAEKAAAEEAARAQAEAAARAAEQARASAAAPAIANSTTATNATAQSVIDIARSWVGRGSYVWGGNDPATGVDCSGFTRYVYAQVGVNLNRLAADQANNGTRVSADQALPGDLVVWSGHVGIYSGNGMMINAENPGSGIREDPISYFMSGSSGAFYGYYRISGIN